MSCQCTAVQASYTCGGDALHFMKAVMRILAFGAAILLLAFPGARVQAASLGNLMVLSGIGEPFRGEIELVNWNGHDLNRFGARLASAESHKQAGLQYVPALQSLRFNLAKRPKGQSYIKVTSKTPLAEPAVDLLIDVVSSTETGSYSYTALIEPTGKSAVPFAGRLVASEKIAAAVPSSRKTSATEATRVAADSKLAEQVRVKEEEAAVQMQKLEAAKARIVELQQTVEEQTKALTLATATDLQGGLQTANGNAGGQDAAGVGVTRAVHTTGEAAPRAKRPVAAPRAAPGLMGGILDEPLYLGAAGALLIASLALVWIRRRRSHSVYTTLKKLSPA